jgi:hypothetical protein
LYPQKTKVKVAARETLWSQLTIDEKQKEGFNWFQTKLRETYPVNYDVEGFSEEGQESFFQNVRYALKKYDLNFADYDAYLTFLAKNSPLPTKYARDAVAYINDMEFALFEMYEKTLNYCFPLSEHPNPKQQKANPNDLSIRDSYTYRAVLEQIITWIKNNSKNIRDSINLLATVDHRDQTCQYIYDEEKEKQQIEAEKLKIAADLKTCQEALKSISDKKLLAEGMKKCQDEQVLKEKARQEKKVQICQDIKGCQVPNTGTSVWNRLTSFASSSSSRAATSCVSIDRKPQSTFEEYQKRALSFL